MDIRSSRCGLKSKGPPCCLTYFPLLLWGIFCPLIPPFALCELITTGDIFQAKPLLYLADLAKFKYALQWVAHNEFEAPLNTYSWQITCKMPFSFQIQFSLSAATPCRVRHAELKQPPGYWEICLLTLWSASQFTVRVGHPSLASSTGLFPFYFAAALVFERHGLYTNKEKSRFDPIECKDSLKNELTANCLSGPVDLFSVSHQWLIN